jgi:hypothetical protein
LESEAAKFKADHPVVHIAGCERGEEGGGSGAVEFCLEEGPKFLFCLKAEFGKAPGIGNWFVLDRLEKVVAGSSLEERSSELVVSASDGALFVFPNDGAGECFSLRIKGSFVDEILVERSAVSLERGDGKAGRGWDRLFQEG